MENKIRLITHENYVLEVEPDKIKMLAATLKYHYERTIS